MICAFHITRKPRSANKQPNRGYSNAIHAARKQYAGPLVSAPLYSRIIWFHKYNSTQGDADNIAKRIHDALIGTLFVDDRIIAHTLAVRVDASQRVDVVPHPEHGAPAVELVETLSDDTVKDILYVELGLQTDSRIHLGPIK